VAIPAAPSANQAPPAGKVWTSTWSDDFSGSSLDRTKWNDGWFVAPSPVSNATGVSSTTPPTNGSMTNYHAPDCISFPGGGAVHLQMKAGSSFSGRTIKSGCITTANLMTFNPRGRTGSGFDTVRKNVNTEFILEIRMKNPGPNSSYSGTLWHCINTYNNGNAPNNIWNGDPGGWHAEIDLWEQNGHGSLANGLTEVLHQGSPPEDTGQFQTTNAGNTDLSNAYHTYTWWTDGHTEKMWFDGTQISPRPTQAQVEAQWNQCGHYLIIEFDTVGAPSPLPVTREWEIDYVAVYQPQTASVDESNMIKNTLLGGGSGNATNKDATYFATLTEDIDIMCGWPGNPLNSPGWGSSVRAPIPDSATWKTWIAHGLKSQTHSPVAPPYASRSSTDVTNMTNTWRAAATNAHNIISTSANPNFKLIWEFFNEPQNPGNGVDQADPANYAFWLHHFRDAIKEHPTVAIRTEQLVISGGAINLSTQPASGRHNFFQMSSGQLTSGGMLDWYLNLDDPSIVGASHRISQIGLDGLGVHPYFESDSYQRRFSVGGVQRSGEWLGLVHWNGFRICTWIAYFFTRTGSGPFGACTWVGGDGAPDASAFRLYGTECGINSASPWQNGKTYPTDWSVDATMGSAASPDLTNPTDPGIHWNGGGPMYHATSPVGTQPPSSGWAGGRGTVHDSGQSHQIFGENNVNTAWGAGHALQVNTKVLTGQLIHPDWVGGTRSYTNPRTGNVEVLPANFPTANYFALWQIFRIVDGTFTHGEAGEDGPSDWFKRNGLYFNRVTAPTFTSPPKRARKGAFSNSTSTANGPLDMLEAIGNTVDPRVGTSTDVPDKVTGVGVSAGNGQVGIFWDVPFDGGSPITQYTVDLIPNGPVNPVVVTAPDHGVTITGLANNTTYTAVVTAENINGAGLQSDPETFTPTADLSGIARLPVGITVRARGTKTQSFGTAKLPVGVFVRARGSKKVGVPGLAKLPLGVFVRARGTATIVSQPKPPPPGSVIAAAGDGYVDVSWSAVTLNGPITGYRVTAYTSAGVAIGNIPVPASPLSKRYQPLTNGTAVKFTIAAQNAFGSGTESGFSNLVTPTGPTPTAPDPPTNVIATAGVASASVDWDPSVGATSYLVTASPGGATRSSTTTNATFSPLTVGTSYTFTVRARNTVGLGLPSEVSNTVVPFGVPATGPGLGVLSIESLHGGERSVEAVHEGVRTALVVHAGERTVEALHAGERTLESL
jgi:hypothetical protein